MNSKSKQSVYFLAKCAEFTSESAHADKNGLDPVVLTPIGGKSPRGRNIVSGTIAESEGFEPGKMYLVLATHTGQVETEDGEVTESYTYTSIAEYSKQEAVEYVMNHPLEDPVIAPQFQQDLGDPNSRIQKVKGNPRARRIRERDQRTGAAPNNTMGQTKVESEQDEEKPKAKERQS